MTDTSSALPADAIGLPALEARLREDLAWLCRPSGRWTLPQEQDGVPVRDVLVVGGGMAGLTLLAALQQQGIDAAAWDQSPEGFEGPWATTARMETLRSPKELTGPALGLPALTFRAWFQAQFGLTAWNALDKIPRLQWMDYLRWYRQVLKLEVHNGQRLIDLEPVNDGPARAHFEAADGTRHTVLARHVVIATGRDGLGGPWVPDWAAQLPRDRWAHSADTWDGAALHGLRVVVIGGGASAMDSAATALEAGAAEVNLLIRRTELPRVNKSKGAGSPGMAHGFHELPDAWKWRWRHYINAAQVPPPRGSTQRVSRHANARFLLGTAVQDVSVQADGSLRLATTRGELVTDFILFSTGFETNWSLRPEFNRFAADVRTWGERYQPPAGEEDAELAGSPDLGPVFEFQSRRAETAEGLARIHAFCYAASLSHGTVAGDIPQVSVGAQRLAQGLASRLLAANAEAHFAAMRAYAEPELLGDEWTPAPWPQPTVDAT